MMEAIAKHRYARTSAQKARLVADQVRGLSVDKALNILTFSPKKAAVLVKKVLESFTLYQRICGSRYSENSPTNNGGKQS